MKITRVYNNNVVLTYTNNRQEAIAVGAGIGYQMKPGMKIKESKIEKMFYIQNNKEKAPHNLYRLLERIPAECFEITQKILEIAYTDNEVVIDDTLIVVLADHIAFALKRARQHEFSPNLVLNEIKALYKTEYELGIKSLDIIEKYTNIMLPDDEAGYLAMHIINAKISDLQAHPTKIVYFTKDIIDIAKATLRCNIDEDSLDYCRLTTHLKFLAKKILTNTSSNQDTNEEDYALYTLLKKTKPNLMPCINTIRDYIRTNYEYPLNASESLYLLMHFARVYTK